MGGETKIRVRSYGIIKVVETVSPDRAKVAINLAFLSGEDIIIGAAVDVRHNP